MNRPLLLISAVLIMGLHYAHVAADTRPNILFILSDDQRDDSFSGMGHSWVKTPQIDSLLARSVRFENTYIAEPTCNPSRAAILLGCHERINRQGFSSRHPMTAHQWEDSYPARLRKAGYQTGFVGKWHVSTKLELESLFDFWAGQKGHGNFYYEVKDEKGNTRTITCNRWHTNHALRFLQSTSKDRPFCLSLCYATPHGSKVKKMHRTLDEPASENPNLKNHPIYGGMCRDLDIEYPLQKPENPYDFIPKHVMDQDSGRNKTYNYDYDPVMNKEHHYRYFQMITELDQMIGELVGELEAQGVADNTIIIFGSDHGLLMGE